MRKAIICDNEEKMISRLDGMIEKLFPEQFQISGYVSLKQLMYEIEDEFLKTADLIFLDLEIEGTDGVKAAKQIQQKLPMARIIFVTGYPERTEEIFDEICPFGLMLKPFREERLEKYIKKELKEERKDEGVIKIKKHGRQYFIPTEQIFYVESSGRKLLIHKENGIESVNRPISDFCNAYQNNFIRCHQGYAVNKNQIMEVSSSRIRLKNGETVPVSRQRYREIQKDL